MAGRKKLGHVRAQLHVDAAFWEEVKREAKERKATLGDLVEEAFRSRAFMIKK